MDEGAYMSDEVLVQHTAGAANSTQDMAAVCPRSRKGDYQLWLVVGIDVRRAHESPEKPAEGHASHCPFDKNDH